MSRLWRGNKSIYVDSTGASGGLTISWNPVEVVLDNLMASHHSISANFHPIGTNMHGRITNVYGPQIFDQKLWFLDFLQWSTQNQLYPLDILEAYFNLTTLLKDKWGVPRLLS